MNQSSQFSQPFGTAPPDNSSNNLRHAPSPPPKQVFRHQKSTDKPPFQAFIRDFPSSLYYFSQNRKTSALIDQADVDLIINTTKEHSRFRTISLFSIGLANLAVTTLLQRKSKIFGLTYQVSLVSLATKYVIVPLLGTSLLDVLVFVPRYSHIYQKIKTRYDFLDPFFIKEYELDPDPYKSIHSFINHKFGSVQ